MVKISSSIYYYMNRGHRTKKSRMINLQDKAATINYILKNFINTQTTKKLITTTIIFITMMLIPHLCLFSWLKISTVHQNDYIIRLLNIVQDHWAHEAVIKHLSSSLTTTKSHFHTSWHVFSHISTTEINLNISSNHIRNKKFCTSKWRY